LVLNHQRGVRLPYRLPFGCGESSKLALIRKGRTKVEVESKAIPRIDCKRQNTLIHSITGIESSHPNHFIGS
jgi:hypothetical protein